MKSLYGIAILMLIFFSCKGSEKQDEHNVAKVDSTDTRTVVQEKEDKGELNALLTQAQAEKILGTPVTLRDSSTAQRYTIVAHQGTFQSTANDGSLYYLIEKYQHQPDAVNKYAFIKASNETSQGFKQLKGVGDNAYFHTDGSNFYYAMVRRGKNVFSMKVNKVTATTSLEDFNRVVTEIAEKL